MKGLIVRRSQLALLFILIAPLQSFAGFVPDAAGFTMPAVSQHCPHHAPADKHTVQQSTCGMNCCAALPAQDTPQWTAPRIASGRAAALISLPSAAMLLYRLDRPPR